VGKVKVFGAQGRTIKIFPNTQTSMKISLDEIPAGFYIMELKDANNATFVKRLVNIDFVSIICQIFKLFFYFAENVRPSKEYRTCLMFHYFGMYHLVSYSKKLPVILQYV